MFPVLFHKSIGSKCYLVCHNVPAQYFAFFLVVTDRQLQPTSHSPNVTVNILIHILQFGPVSFPNMYLENLCHRVGTSLISLSTTNTVFLFLPVILFVLTTCPLHFY